VVDRYSTYAELAKDKVLGRDYNIQIENRKSGVAIIAPHAGKIEAHCSLLATYIAGADLSLYLFEGLQVNGNGDLHITSAKFDEPEAIEFLGRCEMAVGIHGRSDQGDSETIWVGGRNKTCAQQVTKALVAAGFSAAADGHHMLGHEKTNICNRGISGAGLQLELPLSLRRRLALEDGLRDRFVASLRKVLLAHSW